MSGETFTGNEGARSSLGTLLYGAITKSLLEATISVGASAVKLPTTPLKGRSFLIIQNVSTNTLYVGSSTVTTANGIKILPNGNIQLPIQDNVDVYGIASGAASDVRLLEGS